MKISQEADYAMRIVYSLALCEPGDRLGVRVISENMNIPLRFALKIFRKLNLAGITKSYRGVYGGYALAKRPDQLSFRNVIEAIDGVASINRCVTNHEFCNRDASGDCPMHKKFEELQKDINAKLEEVKFSELLPNAKP
ncbi:MAG: RrF2 family transcriptional regulator [Christensenellales bacterium]|jgi:Rrf2 family iron-sulfur cluster assembly transcriptional regulator